MLNSERVKRKILIRFSFRRLSSALSMRLWPIDGFPLASRFGPKPGGSAILKALGAVRHGLCALVNLARCGLSMSTITAEDYQRLTAMQS